MKKTTLIKLYVGMIIFFPVSINALLITAKGIKPDLSVLWKLDIVFGLIIALVIYSAREALKANKQ